VFGVQVGAWSHEDKSDKTSHKPHSAQENQANRKEQGKTDIAERSCEDKVFALC
jgi:hypothetical protein